MASVQKILIFFEKILGIFLVWKMGEMDRKLQKSVSRSQVIDNPALKGMNVFNQGVLQGLQVSVFK